MPLGITLILCMVTLASSEANVPSIGSCPRAIRAPLWLPTANGHDPFKSYYRVSPYQIGVEIEGVDLATEWRPEVIERIRRDVITYGFMVFRNQSVGPMSHLEVGRWFGDPHREIKGHSKQEHRFLMRVSNEEREGATWSGVKRWHIDTDGIFPATHVLFSTVQAPRDGPTRFVRLDKVLQGLSNETRKRWERLWFVENVGVLPTVCLHPVTGKETLMLRLRYLDYFLWNYAVENERPTREHETKLLIEEITEEIEKHANDTTHLSEHMWQPGDFVIVDNRAVAHMASVAARRSERSIGLRLLRRMVVGGRTEPRTGSNNPAQRALPVEPWYLIEPTDATDIA